MRISVITKTFIFAVLIALVNPLAAVPLDSLKAEMMRTWRTAPEATIASAKNYAEQAMAEEQLEEVAWALNFQGIVFGALGEFDSSYAYYDQSLHYSRTYDFPAVEKKTLMNLAINYQYQGRFTEAMAQFLDAIRLFEKENDTLGQAHAYNGLGNVYRFLDEERKSISAYQKSLVHYGDLGLLSQTGVVWSNLGTLYRDLGQFDSAFYCMDSAEVLLAQYQDRIGLASLFINKAGLFERSDGETAKGLYQKALKIGRELNSTRIIAQSAIGFGRQALEGKNYRLAISSGKEGLSAAREMEDLQIQKEALEILAMASNQLGQSKPAFDYQFELSIISDSILNLERQKTVAELEIKYETEKKEKEIAESESELAKNQAELLNQEVKVGRLSQLIIIVAALAILLITIIAVVFYLQSEKRKRLQREKDLQQRLEAERREREMGEEKLRISRELHDNIGSQITFMVSSMDNMKYVIDAPNIVQKLDQLSGFGRDAIADLRHAIWALKADAKLSDVILKVRQMVQRLSGNLKAKIVVEEDIKKDHELNSVEAINLLRIVQEAVQNAAKYAEADQISIRFVSKPKEVSMNVVDDGKGFDLNKAHQQGEGLGNMQARAQAIGAQLSISSAHDKGTNITFVKQFD